MNEPTLSELHQKIDAGVRSAIREAIERHRRLGESITFSKDGKIVTLTGEQIPPLNPNSELIDAPTHLRAGIPGSSSSLT